MKIFIGFLIIFSLSSCEAQVEMIKCSKNLSDYPNYEYELSNKNLLQNISGDSIFSANVLIILNKPKGSIINMDSIYQFSLAIAFNESLAKARFFRKKVSYDLANSLNLQEFELGKMSKEISNNENNQIIQEYFVGSLIISNLESNWKNQLNSENIFTGGFKQIAPINGEFVKRIYVLEN